MRAAIRSWRSSGNAPVGHSHPSCRTIGFHGAALEHVKKEASQARKKSPVAGPFSVKKTEPTDPE